jgi:hypothetical protein
LISTSRQRGVNYQTTMSDSTRGRHLGTSDVEYGTASSKSPPPAYSPLPPDNEPPAYSRSQATERTALLERSHHATQQISDTHRSFQLIFTSTSRWIESRPQRFLGWFRERREQRRRARRAKCLRLFAVLFVAISFLLVLSFGFTSIICRIPYIPRPVARPYSVAIIGKSHHRS